MIRSGTSPALNYGEAISGESRKDFIHKMQIVLKELRETLNGIKIIQKAEMIKDLKFIEKVYNENDQLISIFVKSIVTAKKNEAR
jgi:four helix bundle protein